MLKKVILFSLQTFSTTGGIQKMTRTLAHACYNIAQRNNGDCKLWSLYDDDPELMIQYLLAKNFKGFKHNRLLFLYKSITTAFDHDVVILTHINLTVIGLLIKFINPKCKIWLITHGVEVWRPLSFFKKYLLTHCDKVLCVSNYTKQEIVRWHNINPALCYVLNNAIDPFLKLPTTFIKPRDLLNKYQLSTDTPILFTLTRLASTEQYKGYEQVIKVIKNLKNTFPGIKYMLAGQSDPAEEIRIKELIAIHQVEKQVILTGFIEEAKLADYFLLADLFVLPSKKEGFGLVFIEALACGLPVICGNADGSVDAIRSGELGKAINVDNPVELEKAITECLTIPLTENKRHYLQTQCLLHFNERDYADILEKLLIDG